MNKPVFVLTNDPDHGTTEDYRAVFLELNKIGMKITTAVFCVMEDDGSLLAQHCRVGETHTLADPAFRDLMLEQQAAGHEIAFHGYSQISNTRTRFIEGLDIFKDVFGHDPFTYIEHGGNPFRNPTGMCKNETMQMDGMNPESEHFIMDILRDRLGCVWGFEALDEDLENWPDIEQVFFSVDDVLFFRRQRMSRFDHVSSNETGGCFVGYTHFGFKKHHLSPDYRMEHWTGALLPGAINGLSRMMETVQPEICTMKELTGSYLSLEAAR